MTEKDKEKIAERPTKNLAAFNYYMEGMKHQELTDAEDNWEEASKAKMLFEQALKLDSTYTDAYNWLGHIYINLLALYTSDIYATQRYLDSGLVIINKSLSYEPDNQHAIILKYQYYIIKGMFDDAKKLSWIFDRAIKNYKYYGTTLANSHMIEDYYCTIKNFYKYRETKPDELIAPLYIYQATIRSFNYMGYPKIATKYAKELLEQNNDSVRYLNYIRWFAFCENNIKTVSELNEKFHEADSTNINYYNLVMINFIMSRDYSNAYKSMNQYLSLLRTKVDTIKPNFLFGLVYFNNDMEQEAAYHFDGAIKRSHEEIRINSLRAQRYWSHTYLAGIYSTLGEKEKAFKYLRMLKKQKPNILKTIYMLKYHPLFDNIRNEPEFIEIFNDVEAKYQKEHKRVGELLREMGEIE